MLDATKWAAGGTSGQGESRGSELVSLVAWLRPASRSKLRDIDDVQVGMGVKGNPGCCDVAVDVQFNAVGCQ